MDGESKIPVIFHERVIKTRWSNGAYTCTVGPNPNFREEPKYLKEADEKELSYHDKIKAEVFSCLDKEESADDYTNAFDQGYLSGLNYALRCIEGKE